ncbi:Translation initiation factor if-1 protein [Thalictrum thalictroides]|uniref:Translation initiation factor IF-1, chloroplastic n=1 Tax=Thalictrum thalictroides TaxID=46969 RepID=A0A7J6WN43_THATH|nr:Translation initiation factor if-1 protein [Thalictrum thalictroides]
MIHNIGTPVNSIAPPPTTNLWCRFSSMSSFSGLRTINFVPLPRHSLPSKKSLWTCSCSSNNSNNSLPLSFNDYASIWSPRLSVNTNNNMRGRQDNCIVVYSSKNSPPGMKEQKWTHEGLITESLSNGMFRVRLDNEDVILGYVSGRIRRNFVRILPGDRVKLEVSRYDSTKGRIVYRLRNSKDPAE